MTLTRLQGEAKAQRQADALDLSELVREVAEDADFFAPVESSVEVRLERALVAGRPMARLDVRDRGPGVPEGHLQEIFQPFFRVSESRDRRSGGTGVGLAITERAVRLHGGSVMARNAVGGGLVVSIALPLPPSDGAPV